jgi:hypothetical protein
VSIRDVPAGDRDTALAHCHELIGGLVAGRILEGRTGDLNDAEFNNYRVEITWPVASR